MSTTETRVSPKLLRTLRDLNTVDLLRASGLAGLAKTWPEVHRFFDGPSLVLARKLAVFDERLGQGEIRGAALGLLADLGTRVRFWGPAPALSGPRLFLANHPGLGDVLALLSLLGKDDLKIIARERPFLQALPNLIPSLFLVPERNSWTVLRRVESHLAGGGAVLTFPAGRIEADPAWADPSASWDLWSASTAFWARRIPSLVVQPLLVSGVRARAFVDPWAARWRRNPEDRDWTAAVLQLVFQLLWGRPRTSRIDVAVGETLPGTVLAGSEGGLRLKASLKTLAAVSRR